MIAVMPGEAAKAAAQASWAAAAVQLASIAAAAAPPAAGQRGSGNSRSQPEREPAATAGQRRAVQLADTLAAAHPPATRHAARGGRAIVPAAELAALGRGEGAEAGTPRSAAEQQVAAAIGGGPEELRFAALKALIDTVLAQQQAGQL